MVILYKFHAFGIQVHEVDACATEPGNVFHIEMVLIKIECLLAFIEVAIYWKSSLSFIFSQLLPTVGNSCEKIRDRDDFQYIATLVNAYKHSIFILDARLLLYYC